MAYVTNKPIYVPVPVVNGQIGLGDVIKRATNAIGLKTCAPCERRAQYLNRLMQFRGRNR